MVPELMQSRPAHVPFLENAERIIGDKFPLLRTIRFSDRAERIPVQAPFFIGLIGAILESAERPCCVVLPEKAGVTISVSTLVSLSQLRQAVPEILRSVASISFQPGDRVLVHPSNLVYEYRGFFCPKLFKLKVIGKNESRSLPVCDVARLEKTVRKKPKGYGNSDLGEPRRTLLGMLVGIPGSINRNLLSNKVVVLGSKKAFRQQSSDWRIGITDRNQMLVKGLDEVVPFGEISDDGATRFFDIYVAAGEPLIAIASRPEELAACCTAAPSRTKLTIIDDIERLVRNLQAFDSIADRQRVMVVAEESQHESIDILRDRGCVVWRFSPEELLIGSDRSRAGGPFSPVLRKASTMRNLLVEPVPCVDPLLDEAGAKVLNVARVVSNENKNPDIREMLFALFAALMSCSEFLGPDGSAFANYTCARLDRAHQSLERAHAWLSPDMAEEFRIAISKLRCAADCLAREPVTAKGRVLLDILNHGTANHGLALVARSESSVEGLGQWVAARGFVIPVYSVNTVPSTHEVDQLVLIAWPSAKRFDRLMRKYVAQHLQILTYPFEQHWTNCYQQAYRRSEAPALSPKRKSVLLGLLPDVHGNGDSGESDTPSRTEAWHTEPFKMPEDRFLLRRKSVSDEVDSSPGSDEQCEAYYIDFTGHTFAFITEGHELPIVNGFVTGSPSTASGLFHRTVKELKVGDFVLFRESGDCDIIRYIAEDEMGSSRYDLLRVEAARWRTALARIGKDPAHVWSRLREAGLSRQLPTVRNWLTNQHMIAPKDMDDVRLIAKAAGDNELLSQLSSVQAASEQLKSQHIRAGFKLTELLRDALPKDIEVPDGREMQLDLGIGKVWIVRVEDIDETPTEYNTGLVNRLLWDRSSACSVPAIMD